MKSKSVLKILTLSFALALTVRLTQNFYDEHQEDLATKQACSSASRQMETSLIRETYEQLQFVLSASGHKETCVTVTDNGRSFTQDCAFGGEARRSLICKAEANTGIKATIEFPQQLIFNKSFLFLILFSVLAVMLISMALKRFAQTLVKSTTDEIRMLMTDDLSKPSAGKRLIPTVLNFLGIQQVILNKVHEFESQIKNYQQKTQQESAKRTRLEQQAELNSLYVEKVKQIRHDIRSPLTSVQSVFEKMNTASAESKTLASAIRRIQILLDDLNQVDHIKETSKLVIAEVIAEEVVSMLSAKFQDNKSAKLTIEYDHNELCPIQVGPNDFQSGLENLVENALDAIPVGGFVKISISRRQNNCLIEVDDNGSGINPELLPQLFSKGGTFGKVNGIGLGLYHTKKNIESWGGSITCVPQSSGTKFEILIPILQVGVVFTGLPHNSTPDSKRCFLVEDDPTVAQAFKASNYQILNWADTFAKGVSLLANGNPENLPIFVDYRLGPTDLGTDLIAQQPMRKNIYLCTNDFDDVELIRKAKALGVRILPKPLVFYGLRPQSATTTGTQRVEIAH